MPPATFAALLGACNAPVDTNLTETQSRSSERENLTSSDR
jgi:hypothetical protein